MKGQVRGSNSARLGEVRDGSRRMRPPKFLPTGPRGGAHVRIAAAACGYRTNATSSIDRAIRLSTAAAVLAVAGIAAYVSDWHAYAVVRAHGESGITAQLELVMIDGLVYASSMVVLYAARHRVPIPSLARWLLGLGIAATLTANMAQGWSTVWSGRWSRPGRRSVSWSPTSSWSGSFAPLGRWNVESQVSTQPRPTAGTMAGANLAQLPRKEGGRASRPAMTAPSGGKIPEIT